MHFGTLFFPSADPFCKKQQPVPVISNGVTIGQGVAEGTIKRLEKDVKRHAVVSEQQDSVRHVPLIVIVVQLMV